MKAEHIWRQHPSGNPPGAIHEYCDTEGCDTERRIDLVTGKITYYHPDFTFAGPAKDDDAEFDQFMSFLFTIVGASVIGYVLGFAFISIFAPW